MPMIDKAATIENTLKLKLGLLQFIVGNTNVYFL